MSETRSQDANLKANTDAMGELVRQSASTLTDTIGIRPVTARASSAVLGTPADFPAPTLTSTMVGTAPMEEVASADLAQHADCFRRSPAADPALHTIAITQLRMPAVAVASTTTEITGGKTLAKRRRLFNKIPDLTASGALTSRHRSIHNSLTGEPAGTTVTSMHMPTCSSYPP